MKRLLRISLNEAFLSLMPIITWSTIGILVDPRLINIYSLTYPLQFIYSMLKAIFGSGANISEIKDKNENATYFGLVTGALVGAIVFGFILFNVDGYIEFMHMDKELYRLFTCYSIIKQYEYLLFAFVLEKLYFKNENKQANKYCVIYSIFNYIIMATSLIVFRDSLVAISISLISVMFMIIYYIIKTFKPLKLIGNLRNFIKYEASTVFGDFAKFLAFLLGLNMAASYGGEYASALTFILLITDPQWDALNAVSTVAKIDISYNAFNYYKQHKEAYKLTGILILSSLLMGVCMFNMYDLNIKLVIIFWILEMLNFTLSSTNKIYTRYLQLEYSATVTTSNALFSKAIRAIFSNLRTPFCTQISHLICEVYMIVSQRKIFNNKFIVDNSGIIYERA